MPEENKIEPMNKNRDLILAVYSLYTNEANHSYLQYTAACAIFYHLTTKEVFEYNLNELLVYDYKESRRYIWEAKEFMKDINVVRDHNYLIRARSKSKTYRDVNAHQCSTVGHQYIEDKRKNDHSFNEQIIKIKNILSTDDGELYDVRLNDSGPLLVNERGGVDYVRYAPIKGFLKDLCVENKQEPEAEDCVGRKYEPFFI